MLNRNHLSAMGRTGRSWALLAAISLTALAARTVTAQSILLYEPPFSGPKASLALDSLSLGYSQPSDYGNFLIQLTAGGPWDLVVINEQGSNLGGGVATALITYVNNGGKLILSHWAMNGEAGLALAMGGVVASSTEAPENVSPWIDGHPLFTTPNTVGPLTQWVDNGTDNGDKYDVAPGVGVALAGFTASPAAGQAAIIMANEGRTLLNGWSFTDSSTQPGQDLIANEIRFLLDLKTILVRDSGNISEALNGQGIPHTLATNAEEFMTKLPQKAWDLAIWDEYLAFLTDFTALTTYMNGGGKLIAYYWNLDQSAALATDLGVTVSSTIDGGGAQPQAFAWNTAHPVFTRPHKIASPVTTNAWTESYDLGDKLTPNAGSVAIGGFTGAPAAGEAAIVLSRGNNVLVNGFSFASVLDDNGGNLLLNQIQFLLDDPGVLYYDCASGGMVADAINAEGLRSVNAGNRAGFLAMLAEPGRWDLAVLNEQCGILGDTSAILGYIAGGGRIIGSYYDLDADAALATAFGISATASIDVPTNVTFTTPAHPIFTTPNTVGALTEWLDTGSDNGDQLASADGSQVPAAFGASYSGTNGAIVIGAAGKTIYNGFSVDDITDNDGRLLLQNQIRFLTKTSRREFGDFDDSGCTDLGDFLFLLDYWNLDSPIGGDPMGLADFLALLDYWNSGPTCP